MKVTLYAAAADGMEPRYQTSIVAARELAKALASLGITATVDEMTVQGTQTEVVMALHPQCHGTDAASVLTFSSLERYSPGDQVPVEFTDALKVDFEDLRPPAPPEKPKRRRKKKEASSAAAASCQGSAMTEVVHKEGGTDG